jgi:dUTP pyrophosphatase
VLPGAEYSVAMTRQTVLVKIKRGRAARGLPLPEYMSSGSAGMDVRAAVGKTMLVKPGQRTMVPTGLSVAVPEGYEVQVRPRSGLAIKHGVTVVNAPGTIDSDYRGEVKILLINLGQEDWLVKRGERIAQLILTPVSRAVWREVTKLDATGRGKGGFGHSGTA